MGIVRRQSLYSSVLIMIGFIIGAVNILIIFPHVMTKEQLGLTRVLMDAATMVGSICTFGTIGMINKFFPYYYNHLPPKKNDMAGISLIICAVGFILFLVFALVFKDFIIRKFGGKSPLFVPYYYLLIPFSFFYICFSWLEAFAWGFKKTIISNSMRETVIRLYTSLLLALFVMNFFGFTGFMIGFSGLWFIPSIVLIIVLVRTKQWKLNFSISSMTRRLKKILLTFFRYAVFGMILGKLIATMDTFLLAGYSQLGDVAIFSITTYLIMVMEIPFRSVVSVSTAVLSESWKNKDRANILHVYSKSTVNLLIGGFFIFGLIWINLNNIPHIFPAEYKIPENLILVMAITKMIDLGTGLNGHVLGTSNFWKFEFYTNIIISIFALFINAWFIKHYGLMGAAWGTMITLTVFNLTRFCFIWYKFNLQPFTLKNLYLVIIATASIVLVRFIPAVNNWITDGFMRSLIFTLLFASLIWILRISDDLPILTRAVFRKIGLLK